MTKTSKDAEDRKSLASVIFMLYSLSFILAITGGLIDYFLGARAAWLTAVFLLSGGFVATVNTMALIGSTSK